jgi:acetyl esterase/lipase
VRGGFAVAGWSAGANIAAVVAQRARDEGGPEITGQLLLNPVTDCDMTRPSYTENSDGYILTSALMAWFWGHYAEPDERTDPRASPLRTSSLADLPPAMIVTCEFDPLRDEGEAYAKALAAAGVDVQHHRARGQIHTSIPAVGALLSGAATRGQMAEALRGFAGAGVPA